MKVAQKLGHWVNNGAINSYAHDDQGDNPAQATEGSTVSSIKINVTVAGTLISSVKVSVALTSAEVIDLAGSVD